MSKKILVVDDEADIVRLLKYNLEKEGFDVIAAQDGKAAIEKAQDTPGLDRSGCYDAADGRLGSYPRTEKEKRNRGYSGAFSDGKRIGDRRSSWTRIGRGRLYY